MTIKELIDQVPFEILQRGKSYFNGGNILELNQGENGAWYAEVEGNYGNYEIEIELDHKSNVSGYHCDCPYDGALCKHIAAIALAIDERISKNLSQDEGKQEESWSTLIKNAKAEDLRKFMLDFGLKNKDFRHQVKLTFSKPVSGKYTDNIPCYQNQIQGIFENYEYQGYIDYRSSHKAIGDVSDLQAKADNYYSKGHHNEAFCIVAAIAMESVQAIQDMDDSSGGIGGAICESFHMIENILSKTTLTELKEIIFDWLVEQVQNSNYNDYGVGDSLEPLFFDTAMSLKQLDTAYNFIDNEISQLDKADGWNKKYNTEKYLGHKIDLLQSEGRIEEADNIVDSNVHFEKFRQIKVTRALSGNAFNQAEELILEGVEIANREDAPGTVHMWKDQLFELYRQQKQVPKYNKLARELFVENTSDIRYYNEFKQTSPKEGWQEQRNKLIAEIKNEKNGYSRGIPLDDLAQVYIEEQMIEELFEMVSSSNNIHAIIKYTDHLKSKYPTELLEHYKAAIEIRAEGTGRSVYLDLVEFLKQMAKLKGGVSGAKALKDSLLDKYKNRPAMKEEFRKLKWD